VLLNTADSSVQTFTMSDEKGKYLLKIKDSSSYLLQFTYLGYTPIVYPLVVNWSKKSINLGETMLNKQSIELKTVTIEPKIIPMRMKGDTLIYDAEAFKPKAGDDVEALLELLPGISLDRDGNLIVHGVKVEKVLVDGKIFFGNDPRLATKNLDAEAIKRIEVINKKTEEAEFTGVDDGEVVKTINLALKEEYKKGHFGRIELALGNEKTYRAKGNHNLYNEKTQASIIGNTNNLNEASSSFNESKSANGGNSNLMRNNSQGINESYLSGINLNHEFSQKLYFNLSYIYKNSETQLDQIINSQNFSPTSKFETVETIDKNIQLNNNSVIGMLKWEIDSFTILSISSKLYITENLFQNQSTTVYSPATPDGNLVSSKHQNINENLTNSWDVKLMRKFNKKGRNWINTYSYSNLKNDTKSDLITSTFNKNLDQSQLFTDAMNKHQLNSNFTEFLYKKWFMSTSYSIIYEEDKTGRLFFDKFSENQFFNDSLSNKFIRKYSENKFKLLFIRNSEKFYLNIGAELAAIQLMVPGSNSSFQFIYPSTSAKYNIKSSEYLQFNYSSQSSIPNLTQLISIPNNTNPNQNYVGNLNLIPEYSQNLSLNYFKFVLPTSFSYTGGINFTTINNKILNQTTINNDLTSSISPTNTDFYNAVTTYAKLNGKLKKYNLQYEISPNFNLNSYDAFLNKKINRVKSETMGTIIEIGRDKKEKWDLNLGLDFTSTQTEYDANPDFNQRFTNLSWNANGVLEITKNLTLYANYRIQSFNAVSFSSGRNIHLLNFVLYQTLKNKQWLIYLTGNDILNQNTGLRRNSGVNSLIEEKFNTRTQFFMLGVSRKFRKRK
tara:strand:+ start:3306 stop:5816 length:2511 start_codon:yes stop_codon:yes gene_type:complete